MFVFVIIANTKEKGKRQLGNFLGDNPAPHDHEDGLDLDHVLGDHPPPHDHQLPS